MEIKIHKRLVDEVGLDAFAPWGLGKDAWSWKKAACIDLRQLDNAKFNALQALLEKNKKAVGVPMLLHDLSIYKKGMQDPSGTKARDARMFTPLVTAFIRNVPKRWLFSRDENGNWLAWYVNSIEYFRKTTDRNGYILPAHCNIRLLAEEMGGLESESIVLRNGDVRWKTVAEVLTQKGYYLNNPERQREYDARTKLFKETIGNVGKQHLATGSATDDVDGNRESNDSYYRRRSRLSLDREDGLTRCVVDIFYEEEHNADRNIRVNETFWGLSAIASRSSDDEDENEDERDEQLEDARDQAEIEGKSTTKVEAIEVPIQPQLVIFDLKRHMRLKVHISQLEPYVYDATMSEKLILPQESKDLVEILVEHKSGSLSDIVKGKAGGAVVLLGGPPGTGKTLTAEVYAESEQRALYSVQASQLGLSASDLEGRLLKMLARSARWNAVMLLDEADVYVRQRGNDLEQNAIVGVFLRVLEYHTSVLFLTTNKPDNVDDAIASRCVARITYGVPGVDLQRRIWRVLADASGIELNDATIGKIAAEFPNLTGRDVKNLLKLASLIARSRKQKITLDTVKFVKRFKPTLDEKEG